MPRKNTRNTKGRIISAAWKLFYEQGYEDTTVEDIVFESETSKGSFYHYFDGKDALLGTLANVFDEKYEELKETMSPDLGAMEKLVYLNHELFAMIDASISMDLLARLLSTQLLARGEKHLLDRNRTYFKLLRQIIADGQKAGQLRVDCTVNEIVKAFDDLSTGKLSEVKLKEFVGHTPIQVLAGILLGIINAVLLHLFIFP